MNHTYIDLSYGDLGLAALLIVVNAALSLALGLGLERQIAVASLRTVVQLLAIGLILQWVFAVNRWYVVLGIAAVMTGVAAFAATGRSPWRYRGMRADSLLSIGAGAWTVGAVGLFGVLHVHPWYEPRYVIPILGMILGNTLTGVSVGVERILGELRARRDWLEMLLAMGATRAEAVRVPARTAVRAGMIPTLNQMSVVGIVSLPGMMTGQVLAGQDPVQAVRYQIVVMFFLAAASGLGTVLAVFTVCRRLVGPGQRLELGRLTAAGTPRGTSATARKTSH